MSLWRAMARSLQARIALGALLLYLGWQVYLSLAAPTKLGAGLGDGNGNGNGDGNAQGKVAVVVTLAFTPDRFHVITMQRFGRVSGAQDQSIEVRGVRRADLTRLARPYWVNRVELYKGD